MKLGWMASRKGIIAAVSGILLLLLLIGYRVFQSPRSGQEARVSALGKEEAFPVVVAKVIRGNLEQLISLAGTVVPGTRVEVFSPVSGRIQEAKVKEAEKVNQGELLTMVHANTGESISIRSPIGGIVTQRTCEPGELASGFDVMGAKPLFTIEDTEVVKIQVGLPETLVPLVKVGKEARVRVEAYPLDHYPLALFRGKITSISPSLDAGSRTAKAEVTIDNRDGRLKPGMFAMVGLVKEKLENVLLVPKESVIAGEESYLVYVVRDNTVQEREVQIGASDGRYIQILNPERSQNPSISGEHTAFRPKGSVQEGDEVVTIGARMVYDGQAVKVLR